MKTTFTICFAIALASCKPAAPPKPHAYTVWLGNAAFAGGYHTNHYHVEAGWITFRTMSGIEVKSPTHSVLRIDSIAQQP